MKITSFPTKKVCGETYLKSFLSLFRVVDFILFQVQAFVELPSLVVLFSALIFFNCM